MIRATELAEAREAVRRARDFLVDARDAFSTNQGDRLKMMHLIRCIDLSVRAIWKEPPPTERS